MSLPWKPKTVIPGRSLARLKTQCVKAQPHAGSVVGTPSVEGVFNAPSALFEWLALNSSPLWESRCHDNAERSGKL